MFLVMCSFNIAPSDTENFEKRSCMKYKTSRNRMWRYTLMIHPWQVWDRSGFSIKFFVVSLLSVLLDFNSKTIDNEWINNSIMY